MALPAEDSDDRVAWIVLDGQVEKNGYVCGPGALLYPEALLPGQVLPSDDALWIARDELCALAICERDFREICDEDSDLGQKLETGLVVLVAEQPTRRLDPKLMAKRALAAGGARGTDPRISARGSRPPVDERGFGHDIASESPLVLAIAAFAEQQSEPEISIEPWLEDPLAEAATDTNREPSEPIELSREHPLPKPHG